MKFNIYKLHFTSPLHIGSSSSEGNISYRIIHSDTFYAALTHCLAVMNGYFVHNGDFPFYITSLFPYYNNLKQKGKEVVFFPMPLLSKMPELADPGFTKKIKRVKWVDSRIFEKILHGESVFEKNKNLENIYGEYLSEKKLPSDINRSFEFIQSQVIQRVSIPDRYGMEDPIPFYMDQITFKDDSGLFFLSLGNTEILDIAINLLKEEGIGSDRNSGMGFFEYEKGEFEIKLPESADFLVNLSLFIPENKKQLISMLDSTEIAYDFSRRGGWISSNPNLRKNAIYGFLPGSVLKNPNWGNKVPEILGKIVDLRPEVGHLGPDHPVWRNGKSIMLPINLT